MNTRVQIVPNVAAVALALAAAAGSARSIESPASPAPDAAQIAAAAEYSLRAGGRALLVMHFGRTIYEAYAAGVSAAAAQPALSITKNLAACAALAAQAEGLLRLDEPASDTLSEWRDDPVKRAITIRQLLDQTSGLEPGYAVYRKGLADKNARAVGLPSVAAPGAVFAYGPGHFEAFEEILRRKLGGPPGAPLAFLQSRVLAPIGARSDGWRRDKSGNAYFSTGAAMTARDLAKFGEFVRTRGRVWLVPRLPSRAFEAALAGSRANPMYGMAFWLNANASRPGATPLSIEGTLGSRFEPERWRSYCISPDAPPDLAAMVGSGGQRVYVVPSRRLVVVRLGSGGAFDDHAFLSRLFSR